MAIGLALTASLALNLTPASAAPAGWTDPQRIPGTLGASNPTSATAPDGADAVTWIVQEGSGDVEIRARLRPAGSAVWQTVPVRVDGEPSVQDLDLAPTPGGDFWLAWVQYGAFPEVFAMRLDAGTGKWTRPFQVFDRPKYGHGDPNIAVGGNGTVLIGAYAQQKEFASPPVYRSAVAVQQGGAWTTRFLSPADDFAGTAQVDVNGMGQLLASFVQGYDPVDKTVYAALRGAGRESSWDVQPVSVAGDAQRVDVDLGEGGKAALAWQAPANTPTDIRLATASVTTGTWNRRDVVTGASVVDGPAPAVGADGDVTTVWTELTTGHIELWSRHLTGGVHYPLIQLSPAGVSAPLAAHRQRPDGASAVLFEEVTSGGGPSQGLRQVVITDGFPGATADLTSDVDGAAGAESLGVTAASRSTVIWMRGTFPDADFVELGQVLTRPRVMSGPATGVPVTEARVRGVLRVGRTATCESGYWVEASDRDHRWFRNGDRIRGADARKYRITEADAGKRLSCRASGTNDSGAARTLDSPARRVS
jgi:hypothetical protein